MSIAIVRTKEMFLLHLDNDTHSTWI